MYYPVLIIGGGPAGAAAGIALQKAGVQTCIVDKAQFPRQKLCGGLVTRKTKDLLNSLIDDRAESEIWQEVSAGVHTQLKLYNRFELASSVTIGVPFDTVYRKVYDNYLVRYYQEKGGTLLDGNLPVSLDVEGKKLVLKSGEELNFDYLIAADGANSWVRHQVGLSIDKRLFCLEINVSRDDFDFEGIGIYFDVIGVGYAWVFPKNDCYCIGIGSTEKPKKDTKAIFGDFLQRIGVRNLEKYPFQGAFVPGGGFLKKPYYGDNVLFAGDAAGFADPLTGEGLYWSLYSGMQAAEAVLAQPDSVVRCYAVKCRPIQKNIRSVMRTRILFHKPLYQFWLKNVGAHPNFVRYFSDHQLSQYEGEGAVSELLKKVPRRYFQHFFQRR
ncbi:MAG: NAD(P)/FAD-dependent oxidoreductase [Bacteroidales bacterium]|nr:NAD(P)/FAD-dependent oxidoreductase [Bacteroidales bacterium]